jgi:DNA-binding MarR family transcriptional regulator
MKREETVDFNIRAAWHAIARMYQQQALRYEGSMSMGLALLNIHSEGTPATKIGPLMGLEARSLTRLLKSMEEKGLIYRKADASDKRSVRIFLTPDGVAMKERSRETVLRFNEAVRERVTDRELRTFFDVIARIQSVVENARIFETASVNR